MSTFEQAKCGSCGAPIIWATTVGKLRSMPVDVDPSPAGTVLLTPRTGFSPLAQVLPAGDSLFDAMELRTSHFATCPQADEHRRPR